jgi:hypothetical protein
MKQHVSTLVDLEVIFLTFENCLNMLHTTDLFLYILINYFNIIL